MDEVEIPTYFLCPISLQLMRDPVTVATGITYDRDNIEKWLFSCKSNTCPVTKQVLSDSDLTPNHTLRRLIQAWCTLNASHGIEVIPTPNSPVNKTQIVKLLKDAEKFLDDNMQFKCLRKLKLITLEGERNRSCLESAGAVEFLVSIIKSNNHSFSQELNDSSSEFTKASDEALSILNQLQISDGCLRKIINNDCGFLEALVGVLKQGNYQSRAYATMLLNNAFNVADPIQLTSAAREFFAEIVRVLRDQISQQASKAALMLLVQLCPWGRNRIKAVKGGTVMVLVELLLEASENRACDELKMILLDQLCRCAEGRAELLEHGAGLAVVSKKILRISRVASDRAVRILCYICKFSATSRVVQEMLEVGVVAKLCLLLQVDCSHKTKERAREILRVHSRVWRNSSCIPSHLLASYPSS